MRAVFLAAASFAGHNGWVGPKDEQAAGGRARRLARVIGQDLALYRTDRCLLARNEQELRLAYGDELREAWRIYRARLPADIDADGQILREELLLALGRTGPLEGKRVL